MKVIFYSLILSLIGIYYFNFNFEYGVSHNKFYTNTKLISVYDWPLSDNFPLLKRLDNPNYNKNDFFTNASAHKNPRWVFGYGIHFLAKIFGVNYYKILVLFKLFFSGVIPVLYFLTLKKIASKITQYISFKVSDIFIFISILLIYVEPINNLFSIAWWKPYIIAPLPQTFGLFFGLLFYLFIDKNTLWFKFLSHLFLSLSLLFHLSVGFWCFVFFIISDNSSVRILFNRFKLYFINILVTFLLLFLFFNEKTSVSNREFVNIYYYLSHSQHYVLNNFGSLNRYSWEVSFVILMILFIIPLILSFNSKFKFLRKISLYYIIAYFLSVLFHYIFTQIIIIKSIVVLSPIRFSFFGYWMLVVIWSILLSHLSKDLKISHKIDEYIPSKYVNYLFLFIIIGLIILHFKLNDSEGIYYQGDKRFFDFIKTTNKNSVFISNRNKDNIDIPILCERAIFIGNGFPFSERFFKEYKYRSNLVYGLMKKTSEHIDEDKVRFFESRKPYYFRWISKKRKLDYVIIENTKASNFINIKPIFKDDLVSVYDLKSFK